MHSHFPSQNPKSSGHGSKKSVKAASHAGTHLVNTFKLSSFDKHVCRIQEVWLLRVGLIVTTRLTDFKCSISVSRLCGFPQNLRIL